VFVLRYHKAFRSDKYMGGAAHKLGLSLIGLIDPALSEELHNHDGRLPITISDLFQSDAHHHWLRVTALRDDVAAALVSLTEQPDTGCDIDGWTVVRALSSHHDWCGADVPAAFIETHWQPCTRLTLEFASPTSFRSVGLYRPLPEAGLVFKSLSERWSELVNVRLPFTPPAERVEAFARDMVTIRHYDIRFVEVAKKGAALPAFQGVVTYQLERDNSALARRDPALYAQFREQHRAYASLLHLLARFSFYGGVGIKTAQGMGMARLLEAHASHPRR
jgi:CRISPR-associated endoribonuclease Cas6